MSMTPAQQRAIIEKESAWVDSGFGQLDLSQFPALQPLPTEEKHDDRFAKNWDDTELSRSATALRNFVEDPDVSALERVGAETGDPNYAREARERRAETVAGAFKRKCPAYWPSEQNYETIVETLAYNVLPTSQQDGDSEELVDALMSAGAWTVENLQAVYLALNRQGLLQMREGVARNLSDSERLHVSRLAQNGKAFEAIEEFLRYSLPEEELTVDMTHDPAYRGLLDTAVLYVWELGQSDYTPTVERRNFIGRYAAGRPLTLYLVAQAWEACKQSEGKHERGELLSQYEHPEETRPHGAKQLDELDDATVNRLYHDSLRAYAQSVSRGAEVLA
jgi:hypothetical protein